MATSGYPDATTAGVTAGVALTTHNGDLVINTPGAVISGLDIHGVVYINAPNVTLINCKVTVANYCQVRIADVTGVTVQNCTIDGVGTGNAGANGIQGTGTFLNNNIFNVENGITVDGSGPTLIQGNYIHDLNAAGAPHYDGIQIDGGLSNITITNNTVINTHNQTSAVMIDNYYGSISNVKVDNNLLVGGGYTIYVDGQFGSAPISGVSITNNHMGSGGFGITNFNQTSPTYTGNVNDGSTLAAALNTSGSPSAPTTPTAPGAPEITAFSNDSNVAGDGVTNDNTLTLSGKAAANSVVKVFDGTSQIGTATATSGGTWSLTTSSVADGTHKFTATATSSGATSAASAALSVKVDTVAPNAPTIATSTSAATLASTHVAVLTGAAEANSVVKVFDGTNQIGTATANSSGAWTFSTAQLANGGHSFTAKAMDAAGNTGGASAALVMTVSPSTPAAPSAPTIASFSNDSGVSNDGITNDSTLTLTGSAAANSAIKVFDGATQIGTATADANGSWSYITSALNDAKHVLTATATNAAGQTSSASSPLAVTIDTKAPVAPTISSTPSGTSASIAAAAPSNVVNLGGTAEANSVISIFDTGKQIGTATAGSTGAWSYSTGVLTSGSHSFTAKASDVAGNMGAASAALVVNVDPTNTSPLAAPKISSFSRDTGKSGDGVTRDSTLTLTGIAVVDSTVKLFDGTKQIGTTTADHSGAWSYTTAALSDGAHSLSAKAVDAAGQTSSSSPSLAVTVDSHAPVKPTMAVYSADGKAVGSSTTADDLVLKGTAEAHSTVNVFDGGKQIGSATANDKGLWSLDTGHVSDGSHSFTSKAVDLAGNTSDASAAKTVAVHDAQTSGIDLTNICQSWNGTVSIKGTADAYSQVKIYDGNNSIGLTKASADGTWSFSTSSAVSNTVHTFSAKEIDSSGQVLASSGNAILGTRGSNTLTSSSGDDVFLGKGHPDTFVFAPNFGNDVVKDFRASGWGHDVVQFSKSVFDNFADVLAHATQSGQDVVIAAGSGDSLTLKNTKLAALDKNDFHFA